MARINPKLVREVMLAFGRASRTAIERPQARYATLIARMRRLRRA